MGSEMCIRDRDLLACRQRAVRHLALVVGVVHPDPVLRLALARMEPTSIGAVRPGRASVLHRPAGAVPAGLHLPDGHPDHLGLCAVSVHRGGRAAVVRLRPVSYTHLTLPTSDLV